jgi:hypothetical protein
MRLFPLLIIFIPLLVPIVQLFISLIYTFHLQISIYKYTYISWSNHGFISFLGGGLSSHTLHYLLLLFC